MNAISANDTGITGFDKGRFSQTLGKFDKVELFIILAGLQAMGDDLIEMEQFEARVGELVARHRAGGDLCLSDMESICTP